MRRPGQVAGAVEAVADRFGRIDILVNNAGIALGNPAEEVTEIDFDRTIAINLKGAFLASQAAGRVMIRQGYGRIVNLGSQAGEVALPGESVYWSSRTSSTAIASTRADGCPAICPSGPPARHPSPAIGSAAAYCGS